MGRQHDDHDGYQQTACNHSHATRRVESWFRRVGCYESRVVCGRIEEWVCNASLMERFEVKRGLVKQVTAEGGLAALATNILR